MKKFILLSVVSALAITAYANELIYCPEYIQCSKEGDINSCQIIGGNFDGNITDFGGTIQKGIYQFDNANAYFDYNKKTDPKNTLCIYKNKIGKISRSIYIRGANQETRAYVIDSTAWKVEGWGSLCISSTNTECPMTPYLATANKNNNS